MKASNENLLHIQEGLVYFKRECVAIKATIIGFDEVEETICIIQHEGTAANAIDGLASYWINVGYREFKNQFDITSGDSGSDSIDNDAGYKI